MKNLEKCIQWEFARSQRDVELAIGQSLEVTNSYEVVGCYDCDGYNQKCKAYYTKASLKALADKYLGR